MGIGWNMNFVVRKSSHFSTGQLPSLSAFCVSKDVNSKLSDPLPQLRRKPLALASQHVTGRPKDGTLWNMVKTQSLRTPPRRYEVDFVQTIAPPPPPQMNHSEAAETFDAAVLQYVFRKC